MAKASYIPWSPSEEELLRDWLSRRQHLSWEKKSQEYRREFGLARGPESLRGKYNQLLKGISRRRSISARLSRLLHKSIRAGRRPRPTSMPRIPHPPPALDRRAPDSQTRELFQRFHPEESLNGGERRSYDAILSTFSLRRRRRHEIPEKLWQIFDRVLGRW